MTAEDTENEVVAVDKKEAPDSASCKTTFTVYHGLEETTLLTWEHHVNLKLE